MRHWFARQEWLKLPHRRPSTATARRAARARQAAIRECGAPYPIPAHQHLSFLLGREIRLWLLSECARRDKAGVGVPGPILFSQIRPRRRPRIKRVFVAILAVVALWLRLVWPAPPTIARSDITALAGLGEHALCLAAPATQDPAPIRSDGVPPPAGDRADHDHSLCCMFHAVGGFVLPRVAAVARIAFAEAARPDARTRRFQPTDLIGAARARGPPGQV